MHVSQCSHHYEDNLALIITQKHFAIFLQSLICNQIYYSDDDPFVDCYFPFWVLTSELLLFFTSISKHNYPRVFCLYPTQRIGRRRGSRPSSFQGCKSLRTSAGQQTTPQQYRGPGGDWCPRRESDVLLQLCVVRCSAAGRKKQQKAALWLPWRSSPSFSVELRKSARLFNKKMVPTQVTNCSLACPLVQDTGA